MQCPTQSPEQCPPLRLYLVLRCLSHMPVMALFLATSCLLLNIDFDFLCKFTASVSEASGKMAHGSTIKAHLS